MILPSDFNITGRAIPQGIVDKIVKHHLIDLWKVEEILPFRVRVSSKSGYRPYWYEIKKGRDGNSQHTFRMKGAVDLTCDDFYQNKDRLLEALIRNTKYTRFAIYNSFIHCDHRPNVDGKRWVYNSDWARIKEAA